MDSTFDIVQNYATQMEGRKCLIRDEQTCWNSWIVPVNHAGGTAGVVACPATVVVRAMIDLSILPAFSAALFLCVFPQAAPVLAMGGRWAERL